MVEAQGVGGQSAELVDPRHIRRDLNAYAKIFEEAAKSPEFVLPDQLMETLPKITASVAVTGSNREKIAAGRLVVAMANYNHMVRQAGTPKVVDHQHSHRLELSGGDMSEEDLDGWRQDIARRIESLSRTG